MNENTSFTYLRKRCKGGKGLDEDVASFVADSASSTRPHLLHPPSSLIEMTSSPIKASDPIASCSPIKSRLSTPSNESTPSLTVKLLTPSHLFISASTIIIPAATSSIATRKKRKSSSKYSTEAQRYSCEERVWRTESNAQVAR